MYNSRRNFTLIELMIAVSIIGIIAAMLIANCGYIDRDGPNREARKHARELGMRNFRVSCVSMDTDGDGYVSCTIKEKGEAPYNVECSIGLINQGCRAPKANLRNHF